MELRCEQPVTGLAHVVKGEQTAEAPYLTSRLCFPHTALLDKVVEKYWDPHLPDFLRLYFSQ